VSQPQADESDAVNWTASAERERRWARRVKIAALCLMVLGLPAWWLWGAVQTARELNHRSSCNCRLKQFGLAMHNYHDKHGSFPPAFVLGPDGQKWHSWRVLILPYLGQDALYREYRFDEPWDGPKNRKLLDKMPEIFACPSQPCPVAKALPLSIGVLGCGGGAGVSSGFTSYAAVLGQDCAFRGTRPVSVSDITDGTSNTFLIGECTRMKIPWTKPEDIDVAIFSKLGDPHGFGSPHVGGAHFLMADGSVKFASTSLPQATLDALFTRNGGERVDAF
jgi:prepilin-type processing-associated H-X9-DG protein